MKLAQNSTSQIIVKVLQLPQALAMDPAEGHSSPDLLQFAVPLSKLYTGPYGRF